MTSPLVPRFAPHRVAAALVLILVTGTAAAALAQDEADDGTETVIDNAAVEALDEGSPASTASESSPALADLGDDADLRNALTDTGQIGSMVLWVAVAGIVLIVVLWLASRLSHRKGSAVEDNSGSHVQFGDLKIERNAPIARLKDYTRQLDVMLGRPKVDIIEVLNHLMSVAISLQASDLHITPGATRAVVTYRVHGLLYDMGSLPADICIQLVSRIKVVSNLAFYKKATPQDGRLRIEGSPYTGRVSVLPTNHGEKVVLRLSLGEGGVYDVEKLGMTEDMVALYKALLNRDQGVIIVTGPTGSGKTSTMYASLRYVQNERIENVNIVTLEDPIEFDLPGLAQTQISEGTGLSFAVGLRSVLRQDPDVIMLGEIRDEDTATNAMRAAMTGHLIFSTVHADNAAGVFGRLIQMGIEPYILASAVAAVVSQRLVRRICEHCRVPIAMSATARKQLELLNLPTDIEGPFYHGPGCDHCVGKGSIGRIAIFEILVVNDLLRDQILSQASAYQIQRVAEDHGMYTLFRDGLDKARAGLVTLEDVLRVVSG